jgi:hypothetical protein
LAIILKEEGRGRPPEMERSIHLTQTTERVKGLNLAVDDNVMMIKETYD